MDTFQLSPDTAVQSKAQSVAPQSSKDDSGDTFDPALESAIATVEQNDQAPAQSDQSSADKDVTNSVQTDLPSETMPDLAKDMVVAAVAKNTANAIQDSQPQAQLNTVIKSEKSPLSTVTPVAATLVSAEEPVVANPPKTETTSSKAETILLQQIQKILDDGKNEGAIVIKNSREVMPGKKESIEPLQSLFAPVIVENENTATIQARQNNIIPLNTETKSVPISSQNSKPDSLRQGMTEQLLNAKFGDTENKSMENQQQNKQNGNDGQSKSNMQQTVTANSSSMSIAEPASVETSFGQQLGLHSTTPGSSISSSVSVEGKFAPGAHLPVPEQEIVNNLIQKFNINPRLQTSKLTMQLHPTELGQIKIDITVKENTISANIVAQSQQVLETLEKNMSRLRGVLEDQGFIVDSFEISINTDDGSGQQMFHEQFESKQQNFLADNKTAALEAESFDALMGEQEIPVTILDNTNGVNITA